MDDDLQSEHVLGAKLTIGEQGQNWHFPSTLEWVPRIAIEGQPLPEEVMTEPAAA